MPKFRKKPVVIEAYRTYKECNIKTLEGTMHANAGDWIITGVHGEQYPCKPDIFMKTYEPVSDAIIAKSSVKQEDIADIMNMINDALKNTEYEAVAYDNTGVWLHVIIDKK